MEVKDLYLLVKGYYGYKAKKISINTKTQEVACILYDSFLMKCDVYDRHSEFGAGIILADGQKIITEFLGKKCSLNSDDESTEKSLGIIDDYCRLRLPDKFLEAYDKAYLN